MTPRLLPALCALAVSLTAAAGLITLAPAGHRAALYILAALLLGGVMLLTTTQTKQATPATLRLIFAAGILARLTLIPAEPFTTHDVARYLWDGSVLAAGHDPWRVPPNDPRLQGLTDFRAPPENAHIPTIYPPAAVTLFAFVSRAGPWAAVWLWKILVAAASIALLAYTRRLLEHLDKSVYLPLIAFSPLVLFESGIGAHLDIFCAAFVAAALLAFVRKQPLATGLLLGSAAALKLLPAVAALPLMIAFTGRDRLRFGAAVIALPALTYGSAFLLGFVPIGSLPFFFEKWRFGSLVFPLFEPLLGDRALYVALFLGGLCVAYSAYVARKDPLRATSWAMAGPLVASPVVFPWYLLPLAAVTAARPSAFAWSVLLAAPLTYEVVDRFDVDQSWEPASWPLITVAAAMAAAFLFDVWRRRADVRRGATQIR